MAANLFPEFDDLKAKYYSKQSKNSTPIREFWLQDLRNRAKQEAKEHGFDTEIHASLNMRGAEPYLLLSIKDGNPDAAIWLYREADAETIKKAYAEYFRYNWFHDEITGYRPEDLVGIAVNKFRVPVAYILDFMDVGRLVCTLSENYRGQYYNSD